MALLLHPPVGRGPICKEYLVKTNGKPTSPKGATCLPLCATVPHDTQNTVEQKPSKPCENQLFPALQEKDYPPDPNTVYRKPPKPLGEQAILQRTIPLSRKKHRTVSLV